METLKVFTHMKTFYSSVTELWQNNNWNRNKIQLSWFGGHQLSVSAVERSLNHTAQRRRGARLTANFMSVETGKSVTRFVQLSI